MTRHDMTWHGMLFKVEYLIIPCDHAMLSVQGQAHSCMMLHKHLTSCQVTGAWALGPWILDLGVSLEDPHTLEQVIVLLHRVSAY